MSISKFVESVFLTKITHLYPSERSTAEIVFLEYQRHSFVPVYRRRKGLYPPAPPRTSHCRPQVEGPLSLEGGYSGRGRSSVRALIETDHTRRNRMENLGWRVWSGEARRWNVRTGVFGIRGSGMAGGESRRN